MIKAIEKKCVIYEDCITLRFIDTRDNYIYPTALGDIGEINICEKYVFLTPNDRDDTTLNDTSREKVLYEAFKEIFGTKKIDYLSAEYYTSIKNMIATGALKSLGYKITTSSEEELDEDYTYYNNKQHRKH